MNEKIKELMLEAGYAAPEIAGRAQKFAELIVKECMEVANTYQNVGGNCYVDDMIAKHFGVEE